MTSLLNSASILPTANATEPIAVRFTEHAGTFVLHCHNLEHEGLTMMADVVTAVRPPRMNGELPVPATTGSARLPRARR